MTLPARTADTMSDAIALSSPCGRMSKRARAAAEKRLSVALFGNTDLTGAAPKAKESKRDALLRHAATSRRLAAQGFMAKKLLRDAEKFEALAALEPSHAV